MPNVLTVEERERVGNYAERWIAAGNVEVLSSEEQTDLIRMLKKVVFEDGPGTERGLVEIELAELDFSGTQSNGLYADSSSPEQGDV